MREITTDVLIVGTGPAGSACAALLSTYGIDNMVVNLYRWLANTPRAHITNLRTMEVLRDLGREVEQEAYLHATDQDLMGGTVFCESLTGEEIGRAPQTMPEDVARAVGRAREAQRQWSEQSFQQRARLIMKARKIILQEMEEIAQLISRETGKPVAEAISMELAPTLDLMQYFARKGAQMLRPRRISVGQYALMGRSSYEIYKPLGVIGIVSPWNFPWATPLDEVVMALVAGNTVVLKPSELTPLTGLKIKDVFKRAGLAVGVLQIVTGDGSTGAALVGAGVDKIMFTGSVATGKRVAAAAAKYL